MIQEKASVEDILGSKAKVKILKVLAINNELNITSIIDQTHLNHASVLKHLKSLKSLNLVEQKNFGRIKILRFKEENLKARGFKHFLNLWENHY